MKIFNHTEHKKLWNWLADNPDKTKDNYFDKYKSEIPCNECFACDYTCDEVGGLVHCAKCPLTVWGADFCHSTGGLYDLYLDAKLARDAANVTNIARQIANLPVKEGVICDDLDEVPQLYEKIETIKAINDFVLLNRAQTLLQESWDNKISEWISISYNEPIETYYKLPLDYLKQLLIKWQEIDNNRVIAKPNPTLISRLDLLKEQALKMQSSLDHMLLEIGDIIDKLKQ